MRTLYVIGNGFDLAHSLPTKYNDLKKWLIQNGYIKWADMFEKLYYHCNDDGKWSDIEAALGQYDIEEVYKWDKNHSFNGDKINDDPGGNVVVVTSCLEENIKMWAKSIDISSADKQHKFEDNSLFLTFNYTLTLEKVYGIQGDHILHIHGDIDSKENIVIGYKGNQYCSKEDYPTPTNSEETTKVQILDQLRRFIKDTSYIIEKNRLFFNNLKDISHIVVFGHSCSDVDRPYFEKLAESVLSKCKWTFFYHEARKKSEMENFAHGVLKPEMSFEIIMN